MNKFLPLIFIVLINLHPAFSQEPFFSEFTPDGTRSVLELFNPENDTLNLTGYNVRLSFNGYVFPSDPSDNKYFDLAGYQIMPGGTFIIAGKDAPQEVKDLADVVVNDGTDPGQYILHYFNDDALGLFKGDSLLDIIGKNGVQKVWDVAGIYAVTAHNINGARTIIRKPYVFRGNTDWDEARGYVSQLDITLADSSEWLVYDKNFLDLGKHQHISPDSAVAWSDWFKISASGTDMDTIYFVPLNYTGNDLMTKILTIPGVLREFYRGHDQVPSTEILQNDDKLLVWNADTTRYHTYLILSGNYDYLHRTPIISEVVHSDIVRAIEICNTSLEPLDLTGWGVARDKADNTATPENFTGFPAGKILAPGETFVIGYIYDVSPNTPSSNVRTFAEHVIPFFDSFEKGSSNLNVLSKARPATAFTLLDPTNKIVDRFQPGTQPAVIDGNTMAFNMASLARRPYVTQGIPVWMNEMEADPKTSTWTWKPYSHLDLGKHLIYPSDTAFVSSDYYQVSSSGAQDSIFPLRSGITCSDFLKQLKVQYPWIIQIKKEGTIQSGEVPVPEGALLEVISTDLSFTKTYLLSFGKGDLNLVSAGPEIVQDTIYCKDLYETASGLLSKLNSPEGGLMQVVNGLGHIRTGYLCYGDRVMVTAEDLSRKLYPIGFKFPAGYTVIRTPFYLADTLANTITGVPFGEDPALLINNLVMAEGQSASVLGQDGQPSLSVKTGDRLQITAPDGTARNYLITTFNPAPSKQVWAEPTQTTLPPGLARSDVFLRTLRHRLLTSYPGPVNPESGKPWETMDALNGFHCTQLRWVSSTAGPGGFIDLVEASGYKYQGSVNPKGSLLKDDNYFEPAPGVIGEAACPNKPGTTREYFGQIRNFINSGSDGLLFHSDGATWLQSGSLDEINICYCDFCNAKRTSLGITNPRSAAGKEFMLNSMLGLLDSVHRHFEDSLGRKIEWSGNNGSPHMQNEMMIRAYTTAYGEVTAMEKYSTPAKWISDFRNAERNGIFQIFQICVKEVDNDSKSDDILNIEQYDKFVCINRTAYAFAYAAGGMASVPWDSYTNTDQTRHFGLLSEYADLSGFIRGMAPYLDGYESGFDYFRANGMFVGNTYTDKRFSAAEVPLEVEGNDQAVAFVRVKPGDEQAPVMIHLLEWFHIYEPNSYYTPYKFSTRKPYTLKLRKSSFFEGAPFSISLLTPMPFNRLNHELSMALANELLVPGTYRGINETAAYNNLVKEEVLPYTIEGDFVCIQVPVLPHYGVLRLERARSKPSGILSAKYNICGNRINVPVNAQVEELISGIKADVNAIVMVQDSLGFNKYKGLIQNGDQLAVHSGNQSTRVYQISTGEKQEGLSLFLGKDLIEPGDLINLGKMMVQTSSSVNLSLNNNGTEDFIISELKSDQTCVRLESESMLVPAGDSVKLTLSIENALPGMINGNLSISGQQCEALPYYFNLRTEITAASLVVRYLGEELSAESVIDFGSVQMGGESTAHISLHNYGTGDLVISGISSSLENLEVSPSSFTLHPAGSALAAIKFRATELNEKSTSLLIRSNSFGPDSILNLVAKINGRAAVMKIMHDGKTLYSGDTISFGEVPLSQTATADLVILNEGNENLNINGIVNESKRFEFSSGQASIIPGGSLPIEIQYAPGNEENFLDSVLITGNDSEMKNFCLYFTGIALNTSNGKLPDEGEISVYPNPFADKIWVNGSSVFTELKVINMNGQVVLVRDISKTERFELDTHKLEPGLYTMVFTGKDKICSVKVSRL